MSKETLTVAAVSLSLAFLVRVSHTSGTFTFHDLSQCLYSMFCFILLSCRPAGVLRAVRFFNHMTGSCVVPLHAFISLLVNIY